MKKPDSIYIHETTSLHCSDGELYIQYGSIEKPKQIVFNVENLYKDLGFIVNQVVKENNKMQKMYLNSLKDELKEL